MGAFASPLIDQGVRDEVWQRLANAQMSMALDGLGPLMVPKQPLSFPTPFRASNMVEDRRPAPPLTINSFQDLLDLLRGTRNGQ